MTIADLLVLLLRFKNREITTKYLLGQLDLDELQALFYAEQAKQVAKEKETRTVQPPVQETAAPEVQSKIHEMFGNEVLEAGGKEYFHIENKQNKRCFDDHILKEHAHGITNLDSGSPPFAAQRPGRCSECGQVILKGDVIILRSKERGAA